MIKKTTNAKILRLNIFTYTQTRSEVNGPDKDKITIWWRGNTTPREKMCGKIITSSTLGTITPLSRINSNQFWVYVGMEITSSRIRQFGQGRYLPSVQRDIFECIQLPLSQITQQEWTIGNFVIRHFKLYLKAPRISFLKIFHKRNESKQLANFPSNSKY